jgi:glycosyltransferase involved in cell wall biosynthesis
MVVHASYPVGEVRVAREALAAIDNGWEVDVVALSRPDEPATEIVDGVRVFRLPLSHGRGGGAVSTVREYVGFTLLAAGKVAALTRRWRYQVVQVHGPPDFLILAGLIPRLLGVPVILDIHDFSPLLFASRFEGKPGTAGIVRALELVERIATRLATAVITVHDPYRRALEARGVPPGKITVVLNSVDERLLPQQQSPPAGSDGFRVVYHGTVIPVYGVEVLVEAAALLARSGQEFRLEVYGEGDALQRVRSRVWELGISDRVFLKGYLPSREVLERVRFASVGVIPNLPNEFTHGMLPTKLLEYAVLGVPIVSAELSTIREHFSPDEVLFFPGGDAAALAGALREVAADPAAAAARAEAARRRYEDYRWEFSAARYVALLERLRRGSRRPGVVHR